MTRHPAREAVSINDDSEYARKLDALHLRSSREVEMQDRSMAMGFITGALIGVVIGLLYAPKTGKETREFLKTTALQTKEEAYVLAERAKEVAIERARQARAAAEAAAAAATAAEQEAEQAQS